MNTAGIVPAGASQACNISPGWAVEALEATNPTAIANAIANLRYSLFYRNSRSLGAPELQTPLITPRPDGYVDFRATGRDLRLRIDVASSVIQSFTLGQHLIDAVPRGDR